MIEKLFDGRPQTTAMPMATEAPPEAREIVNKYGCVQGAAESTADESGCGFS